MSLYFTNRDGWSVVRLWLELLSRGTPQPKLVFFNTFEILWLKGEQLKVEGRERRAKFWPIFRLEEERFHDVRAATVEDRRHVQKLVPDTSGG